MRLNKKDLKLFLDEKVDMYNRWSYFRDDPVSIPHLFQRKEDIEIAGFLTATIAWGRRETIVTSAKRMIAFLEYSPFDFVLHHKENDLQKIRGVIHRTFQSDDLIFFIKSLKRIYQSKNGLEGIFRLYQTGTSMQPAIHRFRELFFEAPHTQRIAKHIPDPLKGSAAKRMNLFLRWMIRKDRSGVDPGIWTSVSPSKLSCPLDVHSGRVARKLGLLHRNMNDAGAVNELDLALRELDATDPVKYDFALFGLGWYEGL